MNTEKGSSADEKWCGYCRKTDHNDSECWCTRAATWPIFPGPIEKSRDPIKKTIRDHVNIGMPIDPSNNIVYLNLDIMSLDTKKRFGVLFPSLMKTSKTIGVNEEKNVLFSYADRRSGSKGS